METNIRTITPGAKDTFIGQQGEILEIPPGWSFLKAGDAGITRKVTTKGRYWRVEVKKGRRTISLGIWAPDIIIREAHQAVHKIRQTEVYKKKQTYSAERREKKQEEYNTEFCSAIESFLNFHETHKELEKKLAKIITAHAIPVGSGTVARTQMIPIEERAKLAVIAWMRHQTTGYDNLKIARVKGERRAVRRSLAQQSINLLANYREGHAASVNCPLQKALSKL